jgi:hypothetical protein
MQLGHVDFHGLALLLIASLCIVDGADIMAPLLLIASLCIVDGASWVQGYRGRGVVADNVAV